MRTFVIADSSKRKAKPVGIITWKPGLEDNQGVFALELLLRLRRGEPSAFTVVLHTPRKQVRDGEGKRGLG